MEADLQGVADCAAELQALPRRLTAERRCELDQKWFGPPESLPEQRRLRSSGVCVTTLCGVCGKAFTLPQAEHDSRLRESRSGRLYCSRRCGAASRRAVCSGGAGD